MRKHLAIAATVAIALPAAAQVTEFEHDAIGWMDAVGEFEARAFDEFVPGGGNGCLVDETPYTIVLETGQFTISASLDGAAFCPLFDGTSSWWASDGMLEQGLSDATWTIEFATPAAGFYIYYGSLNADHFLRMTLYSVGDIVEQLDGPLGDEDGTLAVGHGFTSVAPIDSVVIERGTPFLNDAVIIGAFVGLMEGERSLGTVLIPDYPGPNGENVEKDFAVAWWPVSYCADANQDGVINVQDLSQVIIDWGPCPEPPALCLGDVNADSTVDVADLTAVILAWGECE